MSSVTVASAGALTAALASASSGDVIRLGAGDYGDFAVKGLVFSSAVTIVSDDPSTPASFHTLSVATSQGLHFADLNIDFTPTVKTFSFSSGVLIDKSSDISLLGGALRGGGAVVGVAPDAAATDATGNVLGFPTGYAISISDSQNVQVASMDISHTDRGVVLTRDRNVTIADNEIHDLRRTAILGAGDNDVTISGNHVHDINPWRLGQTPVGDHADFLAFWTEAGQAYDSNNIRIINNVLEQGGGASVLGMWLQGAAFNGTGTAAFTNIEISGNAFLNSNLQGISLYGVTGGTVDHNVLLQTSGDQKSVPQISLFRGVEGLSVTDNISAAISDSSGSTGAAANIILSNLAATDVNPEAANFYGAPLIKLLEGLSDRSQIYATAVAGLSGDAHSEAVANFLSAENIVLHAPGPGLVLAGGSGDDRLVGSGGDDTLTGGAGNDVLVGGGGDDTYNVTPTTKILEQPGDGIDSVIARDSYALPPNVENLTHNASYANAWIGIGNGLNNVITANSGAASLDGAAGDDTLFAGPGSDTVAGGAGDDVINGGAGKLIATGDAGADTFYAGSGPSTFDGGAGDDSILGGSGQSYLRGGDGNDVIVGGKAFNDINGNSGDDTIFGGAAGDWLVGGKGDDVIHAGTGAQLLYGNLGNDTLFGGPGNDTLRGGQGDDSIAGGAGADWISGDLGANTLSGGGGADIFHTSGGGGLDRVLDFNAQEGDRVQLDTGTVYSVSQVGADTVIAMTGGAQMTLVGVSLTSLKAGWIFGA